MITAQELGNVMRSLGQNPSEADLHVMVKEVDPDGDATVTLSKFLTIMAHKMRDITPDDEIKEAFKAFNKSGNGLISAEELKDVLTNLGTFLGPSFLCQWDSRIVPFCCIQARNPRTRISTT